MNVIVVGLSHKTASVEIREKLSIPSDQTEAAITRLCSCPHIQEAAILSTCNRMEIYAAVLAPEQAAGEIIDFLGKYSDLPHSELQEHLFILQQQDAVGHLMQVAAGLDSLVLGEGQILAQVKHAYKLGQDCQGIHRILNQLFKQAITVAKRVRAETSISTGAISISAAAVELAHRQVQRLSACQVAIVGAGKMAQLLIKHLSAKGVTRIAIINRSPERVQQLAAQFNQVELQYYSLAEMSVAIANSNLVFTSTASIEPLINQTMLAMVLPAAHSLTLIDISVPRNVDANVSELTHVQVFNVDDLTIVLAQNQENRRQATIEAKKLIEQEVEAFRSWLRSLEAVSTISCLREKVETIREQEVEKVLARLGVEFGQKYHEVIEALTRGIVNKILHEPTVQLKTQQDLESQRLAVQTLQKLFNLNTTGQLKVLDRS